jgi:hypothetical protein
MRLLNVRKRAHLPNVVGLFTDNSQPFALAGLVQAFKFVKPGIARQNRSIETTAALDLRWVV